MDEKIPRPPTRQEKLDLKRYSVKRVGGDTEQANGLVNDAYIVVFDHFISDGPGYVGKVMLVIWPAGPSLFECFTWNKEGELESERWEFEGRKERK